MQGNQLLPFPSSPLVLMLTRRIVPEVYIVNLADATRLLLIPPLKPRAFMVVVVVT
jgi:hypothetical protein